MLGLFFTVSTVLRDCIMRIWIVLTGGVLDVWTAWTVLTVLKVFRWDILDVWTVLKNFEGFCFGS